MSTMAEPKAHVTPEDLLAMPDGKHYELVEGHILERNVSALSSIVTARLTSRLDQFCEAHQLGWIIGSECGYRCFPEEPGKMRRADVSFVRLDRLPEAQLSEGYLHLAPDLAAEVVSPNDLLYEVDRKIDDYLAAGVRLIWVVNPEQRTVRVQRNGNALLSLLRENDELDGEDVLPGFRCRVGDLFPGGIKGSPKAV
ncbi:Uma2 family endonuclease [Singulisphaera rosea]